ncbi:hypothetical protein [Chitinimonas lacunae]|uniref:Uncharacterized protein n=1 Tax=Chitinimonas lacunae TaxID=1963018 RepID=A0ABV8MSH2_9NEIS
MPVNLNSNGLSLDAFRQAATQGESVSVSMTPDGPRVLAQGQTPSGRQVAWIEPDSVATDTTQIFLQALQNGYGSRIGQAVARELGLSSAPSKPLSARQVEQAIEMATASQSAFSGLNFMSRTMLSASSLSGEFRQLCQQLKIDPSKLDSKVLAQIDADFQQRFDAASQGDLEHIDLVTARPLMLAAIQAQLG